MMINQAHPIHTVADNNDDFNDDDACSDDDEDIGVLIVKQPHPIYSCSQVWTKLLDMFGNRMWTS